MLKNVIAPVQAWLLSQGRCVGCGMPLDKAKSEKYKEVPGLSKVTCKCGRIYIHDPKARGSAYRRALIEEV